MVDVTGVGEIDAVGVGVLFGSASPKNIKFSSPVALFVYTGLVTNLGVYTKAGCWLVVAGLDYAGLLGSK